MSLTPLARRYFLGFGYVCSIFVVAVLWFRSSLNPMWGFIWCGLGLISLHFHTRPQRRYYAPLLMTIFYFFGYLLSIAYVMIKKETFLLDERYSCLLMTNLDNKDILCITLVIFSGFAALVFSTLVGEKLFGSRPPIDDSAPMPAGKVYSFERRLRVLTMLWFAGSFAMMFCMWKLGIGRGGLPRGGYYFDSTIVPPVQPYSQVPYQPYEASYNPAYGPNVPPMTKEEELEALKGQAEAINEELEQIDTRISELEKEE